MQSIAARIKSAALAATTLAACGGVQMPSVDLAGKDPVQANRDLAYCREVGMEYVGFGNEVFRCMRAKGYTIIGAYT